MKSRNILQINSASEVPTISIMSCGKKIDSLTIEGSKLTDTLLIKVEKFLVRNKLNKKNIDAIEVNPGPGPYTSLRVGVTVANLLAFSLNKPISFISDSKDIIEGKYTAPAMPKYGNAPNITKPKPRLK